jgi:hypothetical protein
VNRTACIAAALLLAAPAARAQEPQTSEPRTAKPQDARPAAAAASSLTREQIDHIYHVRQMEQTLTQAVRTGVNSVAAQLQIAQPASLFATTDARTRGFDLEGYGVFFDVDVPAMMQSVLYLRQQMVDDLDTWRQRFRTTQNEDARRIALSQVRRLEAMLGVPPQIGFPDAPQAAPQGLAVAATTEAIMPPSVTGAPPSAATPPATPVPSLPRDPRSADEIYTDAIKNKVIDAILTFGGGLGVEDDQWLTVAARTTTAAPGQIDDSVSIFIRIKGADLTAFVQRKITKEEMIKRIEIKIG